MKNNDFQELVDQNLSGLVWDERKRQRVLHAVSEEEKPVRKISTTLFQRHSFWLLLLSASVLQHWRRGLCFRRKLTI